MGAARLCPCTPCTLRSTNSAELKILDARPRANAYANSAKGAGFEFVSNYPNAELTFYGIGSP